MPYEWHPRTPDGPAQLDLWPYRSLPRRGMVTFIAITCLLVLVPLLAVIGSMVLWGLLPFVLGAVGLMWYFLERSYKDGEILEELRLSHDRIELTRHNPRAPRQDWQANPYWVRVEMHRTGGPVENYLTLKGGDREVEIGAFLSPEERLALQGELMRALAEAQNAGRRP
ncbi:DUF2244 domain-containing protein [Actibacterium ureilyticum]|uniref:DUF2244 domain-containing protein n=1 Tax=Actibacterium ureilyticum TaxID=1590614 RepID=UPI000BAAFF80|nr:DUF2244 domain-containing protein [Actibacterium ureilyticum]